MNWDRRVQLFVESLASADPPPPYRNPYRQPHAAHNLQLFLSRRDRLGKMLLLIGEAPGYRGAAVSGVPFASTEILEGCRVDPWNAFGPDKGYWIPQGAPHRSEATATIVWQGLFDTCASLPLPLTWNAVPFHPAGETSDSNSSVRRGDIDIGKPYIEWMLEFAPNAVVLAVGRAAQDALTRLGQRSQWVRHPSRGGKAEFLKGVATATAALTASGHERYWAGDLHQAARQGALQF